MERCWRIWDWGMARGGSPSPHPLRHSSVANARHSVFASTPSSRATPVRVSCRHQAGRGRGRGGGRSACAANPPSRRAGGRVADRSPAPEYGRNILRKQAVSNMTAADMHERAGAIEPMLRRQLLYPLSYGRAGIAAIVGAPTSEGIRVRRGRSTRPLRRSTGDGNAPLSPADALSIP